MSAMVRAPCPRDLADVDSPAAGRLRAVLHQPIEVRLGWAPSHDDFDRCAPKGGPLAGQGLLGLSRFDRVVDGILAPFEPAAVVDSDSLPIH